MGKTIKIMFEDLDDGKKRDILKKTGIKEPEEMNWDNIPIATITLPDRRNELRDHTGRWMRRYARIGNFTIQPWDSRYYALFDGEEMVCVTVYKIGAIELMKRLAKVRKCQNCPFENQ